MFQEDFTLDISIWRPETDTLVTDATPLLNEKAPFARPNIFAGLILLTPPQDFFAKI